MLVALVGCAAEPVQLAANDTANGVPLEECDQRPGSRIRMHGRDGCEPVGSPFKRFSAEELRATGEPDLADALRKLDPAFQ
jgi:hypothetical protein